MLSARYVTEGLFVTSMLDSTNGRSVEVLSTPCLLLDEMRMMRNIERLRRRLDTLGAGFRPVDQGYGLVCDINGTPYPDLIVSQANQEHGVLAL